MNPVRDERLAFLQRLHAPAVLIRWDAIAKMLLCKQKTWALRLPGESQALRALTSNHVAICQHS